MPIVPVPAQVAATEVRVPFDGGTLHAWDTGGRGLAILLMHAGTGTGDGWLYQQPVFARAGYRVIGYSRRGAGQSDVGSTSDTGSVSEDAIAVLDHLGISKAHVVGTAAGAIWSADIAINYPDRVRSLVLACSLVAVGEADYLARSNALRPTQWATLPADFQELGPCYRGANPEGAAAWLVTTEAGSSIRQSPQTDPTFAALSALDIPILLAGGDADLYAPPSMLQILADGIPDAEVLVFRNCGHSAYWEAPEAFNAAILRFLRRRRR